MQREQPARRIVAQIALEGCPAGPVLDPMQPVDEITRRYFADWETPLAPWGGLSLPSGLQVVCDGARMGLEWTDLTRERALVTGSQDWRNYAVRGQFKAIDSVAQAHIDRDDCCEAHVGIVFRMETSRRHYYLCLEGRRRVALYRRIDNEWFALACQEIAIPEEYLTLQVQLDGDGMVCEVVELGVRFDVTDGMLPTGKVGARALGRCRMAGLEVSMSLGEESSAARRRRRREGEQVALGADIPEAALLRSYDLRELGGEPVFSDFCRAGRYDMLVPGKELRALTADGALLWSVPEAVREVVFSRDAVGTGRLIYAMTGARSTATQTPVTGGAERSLTVSDEMLVIRGSDGAVLARRRLPELHPDVYIAAFTVTSGNLSGDEPTDIVLREWRRSIGGSGCNVWAYNQDLDPLWHRQIRAHYGHAWALQFCDVDGDGRDELLAGGTLFSPEGEVLWVHDREDEMLRINAAVHYDAVAVGALAQDEEVDPVAFLLGGSAGVYVVDALTGRTRMVHRVGHAQGRVLGRMRPDLGGVQLLAACRWGNYGILTLFSGRGDRLWSIQPDYIGQGAQPVWWGRADAQLIWTNTSREALALYDGYGRRVKELPALQAVFGARPRREVTASVARLGADATDLLCLTVDAKMHLFAPQQ